MRLPEGRRFACGCAPTVRGRFCSSVILSSSLARRHGRRRAMLAALPAAPAAPLPKKFFDTFWEPCNRRAEGSLKTNTLLVIPTERSEWRDLVQNRELFRTRSYSCLPPRGKVSFGTNDGRGVQGIRMLQPSSTASGPPSPLKRGKARERGRCLSFDTLARKISPLGQSRLFLL